MHQLNHMEYYKHNIDGFYICEKQCCVDNNDGMCIFRDEKLETVYHFIMECKKYNIQRNNFYQQIMFVFNQYQLDFSLKNILFPPKNLSTQHRKYIFNGLICFVLNTQRLYFNIY